MKPTPQPQPDEEGTVNKLKPWDGRPLTQICRSDKPAAPSSPENEEAIAREAVEQIERGCVHCRRGVTHGGIESVSFDTVKAIRILLAARQQPSEDKARLDWIESQGNGSSWVARQSTAGRGFRLHNTGADDSWNTIECRGTARTAIDVAMKNMAAASGAGTSDDASPSPLGKEIARVKQVLETLHKICGHVADYQTSQCLICYGLKGLAVGQQPAQKPQEREANALIVAIEREIRKVWPELRDYKERGILWPDAVLTEAIAKAIDNASTQTLCAEEDLR